MVFRNPNALVARRVSLYRTKAFSHALEIWYTLAEEREKIIESELKGVTLRVYWHILGSKKQVVGVRAVQRALGLSSPSVALHHLEKLRGLGLLEKDSTGEYHLVEQVKVGVLQNFVGVLGFMHLRLRFRQHPDPILDGLSQLNQRNQVTVGIRPLGPPSVLQRVQC